MITLRYHHLLCVPRFRGKGYNEDFCRNLTKIKEKMQTQDILLVSHADDICKKCPHLIGGICENEDKVARYDRVVKNALISGQSSSPKSICSDCQWFYICSAL